MLERETYGGILGAGMRVFRQLFVLGIAAYGVLSALELIYNKDGISDGCQLCV
jgi:hypothetical protein